MKTSGRSNSTVGWERYSRYDWHVRHFLDELRLSLLICALTTLSALVAAPVLAANNAGAVPQLYSDRAGDGLSANSPAPLSSNPPAAPLQANDSITQVPPVMPAANPTQPASGSATSAGQQPATGDYDDGIIRYEHAKTSDMSGPPIGSLQDFMSEGDLTSPLGIEVREDKRRLKKGGEVEGLLILDVFAGSPAARAGLHPYHRAMRDVLETAAVAGAMFMPPAVLLVPVFDQVHLGESYDLIIGVDGTRVTNLLDFEDRLRDVQAGEIVYFSIVRNGHRMQIQVPVPDNLASPNF